MLTMQTQSMLSQPHAVAPVFGRRHASRRPALLAAFLALITGALAATNEIDLSGTWRFRLDPDASGERDRWFASKLTDTRC